MSARLAEAVRVTLGQRVTEVVAVSGGDINAAYSVKLASGERVFVKTNAESCRELFRAEAKGLGFLAETQALPTPAVLGCGVLSGANGYEGMAYLVLEWVEPGRKSGRFDEWLGRGLATLHRHSWPRFGWDDDNFIGRLPQRNRAHDSFAAFYREERLRPMVELGRRGGYFDASTLARFERLYARLAGLLGPREPPSRLHGDLWAGNCIVGTDGAPWLIDPAVYAGHREIDLAMMRLFGGFSPTVFDSYEEHFPLSPGHEERVELMQLYPLLVHVNHFGQGYVASVQRVLSRYV
jgi:fructosamine-3-kinase